MELKTKDMSKKFLTFKDAATKLGTSSSTNMNFITKDEAIISGADPTPLSSYSLQEFPVDDDIIKPLSLVFLYDGVSDTTTSSVTSLTKKLGVIQHSSYGAMFLADYSAILIANLFENPKNNWRVSFRYTITAIESSENSYNCLLTILVSDIDDRKYLSILRSTDTTNSTIKIVVQDVNGNTDPINHLIYGGNINDTNTFTIEYISNKLYHVNELNNIRTLLWDFGNVNAIPLDNSGLQIGGIQEGKIDFNNPRMIIEYLIIEA